MLLTHLDPTVDKTGGLRGRGGLLLEQLLALRLLALHRLCALVLRPLARAAVALALALALRRLIVVELRACKRATPSVVAGARVRGARVRAATPKNHAPMTLLLDVEALAVARPLVASHLPEPERRH